MNAFESLVRSYVALPSTPTGNGWLPVLCKVCNDHGNKGARAGFRFNHDKCEYNCFNCGANAHVSAQDSEGRPDPKLLRVLNAYDVPVDLYKQIIFPYLDSNATKITVEVVPVDTTTRALQLPKFAYPLIDDPADDMAQIAITHLSSERKINWKDYPFFIAKRSHDAQSIEWLGRLIVPIYRGSDLVFYTGRDLIGVRPAKYKNPSVDRSAVMYGYEFLSDKSKGPIYITEGWFDSFHLKGCCVFGTTLTEAQLLLLNASPRPKVIIPDQYGNGSRLANRGIRLGWGVSTPDIGEGCKDVTDAVVKYGLLYTTKAIIDGTTFNPDVAATKVAVYCKRGKA